MVIWKMSADITPTDFLELLKREYFTKPPPVHQAAASYADAWRHGFIELAHKYRHEWPRFPEGQFNVDITEMMTRPLLPYLKSDEVKNIRCQVAAGVAVNPDINAFVARARHGPIYAIVLHIGLLDFLNKWINLVMAAQHPSAVTFSIDEVSSGKKPPSFDIDDISELEIRLLRQYRRMSYTPGCHIVLTSPYAELAYMTFTFAVMFVLWHEYAHFLEGHLDQADLVPLRGVADACLLVSGGGHEQEYAADARSFEIVAKLLPDWRCNRGQLFLAVSFVFSALKYFHGDTATESHPSPRERLDFIFHQHLSRDEQALLRYVIDAF
jgi:hypothetical protein